MQSTNAAHRNAYHREYHRIRVNSDIDYRNGKKDSSRNWRKNNPDKAKEKHERWKNKNLGYYKEWRKSISGIASKRAGNYKRRSRGGLVDAKIIRELLELYKECAYCFSEERLTIDHIIPISKGGGSERTNLQVLCFTCNIKKGAKIQLSHIS